MGFLERLRQDKETREAKAREAASQATRQKEDRQRHEDALRSAEYKRRSQRWEQSVKFQEESGLSSLVQDLSRLIGGDEYIQGSFSDDSTTNLSAPIKGRSRDPDSLIANLRWDRYENHPEYGQIKVTSWKFLASEMCPDGTVVFYGRRSFSVSLGEWHSNRSILENSLERVYRHHGNRRDAHINWSSHPQRPGTPI